MKERVKICSLAYKLLLLVNAISLSLKMKSLPSDGNEARYVPLWESMVILSSSEGIQGYNVGI